MSNNLGLLKEDEMIVSLHNKKYCELSNNLKHLVAALFGALDEQELIKCERVPDFKSPISLLNVKVKRNMFP